MRVQHKSDSFRYGDTNPEHIESLTRVVEFWNNYASPKFAEWVIDYDWVERYNAKFIRDMKLDKGYKDHFEHTPDLVFYQWYEDQPIVQLIIEVDGQSHDSKTRQISDGVFEEWIQFKYKGMCKLIRINKRELIGPADLAVEHLKNVLAEYLKK